MKKILITSYLFQLEKRRKVEHNSYNDIPGNYIPEKKLIESADGNAYNKTRQGTRVLTQDRPEKVS